MLGHSALSERALSEFAVAGGPAVSLAIDSSTEDASAATLAERLSLTIASSTEDASAGTLTERIVASIAAVTEDYSDSAVTVPPPPVSLAIGSTTETSSDASVTIPSAATPDLSPGGGGRREWDDVLKGKKQQRKPITYAPLDEHTRRTYFPDPPAVPAATPVAPTVTPEVPAFVASALPLPYEPEPATAFDPTAPEDDDRMLAVFAAVLFAEEEF